MRFLALEVPVKDPPALSPDTQADLLRAEALRMWELHLAGVLRGAWFRADRHDAVLEFECGDAAQADAVLASLPLVRAGRIAFDVVALRAYDGWARLFAPGD